jgi:hypothetical protein
MSRRRKTRSVRRDLPVGLKLVFGLTVAAVVLVLAELGARSAGVSRAYQPDRIGGWHMLPAQDHAAIQTREGHSFRLSTNADGLRTHLSRARTPGHPRVAVLGDSIPFGWGADDGQTLADGIQAGFAARGHAEVEVLNAAQPGYSTSQVNRFFEQVVRHYQPDLAIVFLPMHDHNLVVVSDREHLRGADGPGSAIRVALAKHSALFEALRQALFPLADQPFVVARPDAPAPTEPRVPRVSEAERAQNLDELAGWLAEWNGRLAVGHMPFDGDLTSPTPLPRLGADWAESYAAEHQVPIIDLRPCCGPDGGHLVFPHDKGHLTGEGNLLAGRYAADRILEVWTPASL